MQITRITFESCSPNSSSFSYSEDTDGDGDGGGDGGGDGDTDIPVAEFELHPLPGDHAGYDQSMY